MELVEKSRGARSRLQRGIWLGSRVPQNALSVIQNQRPLWLMLDSAAEATVDSTIFRPQAVAACHRPSERSLKAG
ncbi:hypothetical protein [Paraburkholderia sp. SG-MS1]|uniref:hypothetical protein n=1 Tax=Paraburkholderia sp. SG-MS1 TaxID=2023741 RepID=UPI001EEB0FF1|nr:hypothetical protein [Paraburkholderia sp. SG-MS1]